MGKYKLLLTAVALIFALGGVNWYVNQAPAQENAVTQLDEDEMDRDPRISMFINGRFINEAFDIEGLRMGMTAAMVKKAYPKAKISMDRRGQQTVSVNTKAGVINAWFFEPKSFTRIDGEKYDNGGARIFRMRQDQAFRALSEKDVIGLYGRAYGRPLQTTCERSQVGAPPRCTYRWWGGDGIELVATIKAKTDINGKQYFLLTTVATSTTYQKLSKG